MSDRKNKREHDLLMGVFYGLLLGIIGNIWVAVADRLFLENIPVGYLLNYFYFVSSVVLLLGSLIWYVIHRLEA